MKEEQNNKARKHKDQKAPEEFDLASYQPFSKDEEDEDFEILDALEHMDHAESLEEDHVAEGERMIELALDDEDLILEDENMDEEESGFHFDAQMSAGLEQELLDQGHDFDFDKSFEADIEEAELGEDSFVLDLNQEDGEQLGELSFGVATDVEEDDQGVAEFGSSVDFDEDAEETSSSEMGLVDFSLEGQDESRRDLEEQEEPFESEDFSEAESPGEEKTIEDIAGGIEISAEFADLESDISIEDEGLLEQELPKMDFARESDEFAGEAGITVGSDQELDLGTEEELEQEEEFDFSSDSWQQEEAETPEIIGVPSEESEEEALVETEFESETAEEDHEEEFMTSFDDIDLDLEAEATKVLEEPESFGQFDLTEELPETEVEADVDIDLDVEGDMDAEALGSMPLVEDAAEPSIAQAPSEEMEEDEFFEEQFEEEEVSPLSETPPAIRDIHENAEELVELEKDEREFLNLSLRLSGAQMEEFEDMIREAKTLQGYLDKLETHQTEIKKKIYQKLRDEYISRQKDIFRAPEFTTFLTEVNQDLQDMLAKQAEFTSTVERLNEELEEITVRHLVGEYDQTILDEKQASQNAEIVLWNSKNEKIGRVISGYQAILEAEHTLNPLRTEEKEHAQPTPLPEQQDTATLTDWSDTQELEGTEDILAESEISPKSEEESLIEAGLAEEENLSEEMPELEETEEEVFESSLEDDFDLDALSKVAEQLVEDASEGETQEEELEEETSQVEMISCKKCGRQTPASEKFCTHCGAKAR